MSLAVRKATAKGAIAAVNDSMCDIVRFVNETTQGVEDYDVHLKKRNTFTHFTCTTEDPETGMKKIAEVHSCIRTEHTLKSQTKAIMEAGASAAETGGQILGDVKQYVAAQVCMATSKTMTGVTSTSRKIGVGAVVTVGGACNFLKRSFVQACKAGLMIADDDANKRAKVPDASGEPKNLPATQLVQTEAPAAEYVPAAQLPQSVALVCASEPENLPATQSVQVATEVAPTAAENLPAAQSVENLINSMLAAESLIKSAPAADSGQ